MEYESVASGRILYLRQGQGLPRHADVTIHPHADVSNLVSIRQIERSKRAPIRFGSNMTTFPAVVNRGAKPEHHGRAFYASSAPSLAYFCQEYSQAVVACAPP